MKLSQIESFPWNLIIGKNFEHFRVLFILDSLACFWHTDPGHGKWWQTCSSSRIPWAREFQTFLCHIWPYWILQNSSPSPCHSGGISLSLILLKSLKYLSCRFLSLHLYSSCHLFSSRSHLLRPSMWHSRWTHSHGLRYVPLCPVSLPLGMSVLTTSGSALQWWMQWSTQNSARATHWLPLKVTLPSEEAVVPITAFCLDYFHWHLLLNFLQAMAWDQKLHPQHLQPPLLSPQFPLGLLLRGGKAGWFQPGICYSGENCNHILVYLSILYFMQCNQVIHWSWANSKSLIAAWESAWVMMYLIEWKWVWWSGHNFTQYCTICLNFAWKTIDPFSLFVWNRVISIALMAVDPTQLTFDWDLLSSPNLHLAVGTIAIINGW